MGVPQGLLGNGRRPGEEVLEPAHEPAEAQGREGRLLDGGTGIGLGRPEQPVTGRRVTAVHPVGCSTTEAPLSEPVVGGGASGFRAGAARLPPAGSR